MKRTFSTELAYVFGIVFVAWGVVLMEKADFGVSMVVAPAYLLYRWLSPAWSVVTFGMAEYCLQAVLLLAMCLLLRRFRVSYLFRRSSTDMKSTGRSATASRGGNISRRTLRRRRARSETPQWEKTFIHASGRSL